MIPTKTATIRTAILKTGYLINITFPDDFITEIIGRTDDPKSQSGGEN